jgi:hypothetical protein
MSTTDQSQVTTLLPARPTRVPPLLIAVTATIFAVAGFGPNITLAIFALAVLIAGAALLWRPGEAPILLFIFGYHWIEISISIFYSNVFGQRVADFVPWNGEQERAIVLSLVALLLLAAAMRYGAGRWRHEAGERLRKIVLGRPVGVSRCSPWAISNGRSSGCSPTRPLSGRVRLSCFYYSRLVTSSSLPSAVSSPTSRPSSSIRSSPCWPQE